MFVTINVLILFEKSLCLHLWSQNCPPARDICNASLPSWRYSAAYCVTASITDFKVFSSMDRAFARCCRIFGRTADLSQEAWSIGHTEFTQRGNLHKIRYLVGTKMSYLSTFMCPVLQVDSFFEVNLLFFQNSHNDYKTFSSADSLFHRLMIVCRFWHDDRWPVVYDVRCQRDGHS